MPSLTPPALAASLRSLELAIDTPRRSGVPLGNWRWTVRQQMAAVRDGLAGETLGSEDGWLSARGGAALRERNALLARITVLGTRVLDSSDVEATRADLKRLTDDIRHHLQRLRDLAYDEVELELGGSE